ncbi:methyltransferase domain-containing protein [Candidatus Oleimmundimicrobium sp.]|uniref:class I SAM-dependent methyltransferase n=1 Tax=Candidatus Oleimmundimicrobium sp. TaxID=3060597 RepID=UPI002722E664|nr:methyltransferase domain-containing protein [Candidatus Oleimmundimicrobium sp.]MDO8885721.1 methyltransferase domain-containing protein [Candidatus Oleimmundimicrobium sp.]
MRVNLGCGEDYREGYINVDIRALKRVDITADVRNLPFAHCSLDEILAIDIIEHFPQKESLEVLAYWVSLLKKGGSIFIQCPDVLELYRVFKDNPRELIRRLYGGQEYPENTHMAGYTLPILESIFIELDLEIVDKSYINGNLRIEGKI